MITQWHTKLILAKSIGMQKLRVPAADQQRNEGELDTWIRKPGSK
jgi:hypothetical protein